MIVLVNKLIKINTYFKRLIIKVLLKVITKVMYLSQQTRTYS